MTDITEQNDKLYLSPVNNNKWENHLSSGSEIPIARVSHEQ
jgi:hypothetical protein